MARFRLGRWRRLDGAEDGDAAVDVGAVATAVLDLTMGVLRIVWGRIVI